MGWHEPHVTIYVALLDEGVDVWRPVAAEHLGSDLYRLIDETPAGEVWEYSEFSESTSRFHHATSRRTDSGLEEFSVSGCQHFRCETVVHVKPPPIDPNDESTDDGIFFLTFHTESDVRAVQQNRWGWFGALSCLSGTQGGPG